MLDPRNLIQTQPDQVPKQSWKWIAGKSRSYAFLCIIFTIFLALALLLVFSVGSTLSYFQGVTEGVINITMGRWSTATASPTPFQSSTPTTAWTPTDPPPIDAGTSLEAVKTAEGFLNVENGDASYGVSGEVCVSNLGQAPTENLTILDQVQVKVAGRNKFQDLEGASQVILPEVQLQPEETACYPYEIRFAPVDHAVQYRNTAKVTITNHSGWQPGSHNCPGPEVCPFGPEVKVAFDLPGLPEEDDPFNGETEPGQPALIDPPLSTLTPTPVTLPGSFPLPTPVDIPIPDVTEEAFPTSPIREWATPTFPPEETSQDPATLAPTATQTATITPTPTEMESEKSSLEFTDQGWICEGGGQVWAALENTGQAMVEPALWELSLNETVLISGTVPALSAGEIYLLSESAAQVGIYRYRSYSPGEHADRAETGSKEILFDPKACFLPVEGQAAAPTETLR